MKILSGSMVHVLFGTNLPEQSFHAEEHKDVMMI